jgi:hypothetical protein
VGRNSTGDPVSLHCRKRYVTSSYIFSLIFILFTFFLFLRTIFLLHTFLFFFPIFFLPGVQPGESQQAVQRSYCTARPITTRPDGKRQLPRVPSPPGLHPPAFFSSLLCPQNHRHD